MPATASPARIIHLALWTHDIDTLCAFYASHLDARVGPLYESRTRPFSSRFLTFASEVQLEVMHLPRLEPADSRSRVGLAHVAFQLGSREAVDEKVRHMTGLGMEIEGMPRLTGDGYYEAVIRDPDGNLVELVG
jgi:lactoylglutathione lyase